MAGRSARSCTTDPRRHLGRVGQDREEQAAAAERSRGQVRECAGRVPAPVLLPAEAGEGRAPDDDGRAGPHLRRDRHALPDSQPRGMAHVADWRRQWGGGARRENETRRDDEVRFREGGVRAVAACSGWNASISSTVVGLMRGISGEGVRPTSGLLSKQARAMRRKGSGLLASGQRLEVPVAATREGQPSQ
ncbi:hypothetical protein ON010_g15864 [Phytophthora cinnamomi]|nr:hypothetical protein ON010_g15864 [Phytophthora cinnamomi]